MAEIEAGLLDGRDGSGAGDITEDGEPRSRWERLWQSYFINLFVNPRPSAVKRVVDRWWTRYGLLVLLPAALVCLFGLLFCCVALLSLFPTLVNERLCSRTRR